jgi:sugar/nucleoside kinase (ribokinase family)
MDMSACDVYSFGVIASSTLYLLKDPFPERSGYAEILRKYKNVGGEAANSSIALARLGFSVKLDGNWINPDEDATFLQEVFNANQIDISSVSFRSCRGPKEMLVVDPTARTIFGTYAQLHEERSWNQPQRADIQTAAAVCLDPFFGDASRQAAGYAADLGKPIVTVDCKYDDPIFLAAHVAIISEEFLRDAYPDHDTASITEAYRERAGGTAIFTFGDAEILYGSKNAPLRRVTPYSITPVDTTGAGDSFRAGILCGLLKGWPMEEMIRFASATAALVCRSFPGVLNAPGYDEVMQFMRDYESRPSQFDFPG